MKAKDLMEKAHIVNIDTNIEDIKKKLIGAEDCLIVVNKRNKIIGEIHEQDLLKLIIPEDKLDEEEVGGILGVGYDDDFISTDASKIIKKHNITIDPEFPADEIGLIFYKEDIMSIPVVKGKEILGTIHLNNYIKKMLK